MSSINFGIASMNWCGY